VKIDFSPRCEEKPRRCRARSPPDDAYHTTRKDRDRPTKEFPHVDGVLMDWPISQPIATVFSASIGAASLYTTVSFGIIGGEGHETVRTAAISFVQLRTAFDSTFLLLMESESLTPIWRPSRTAPAGTLSYLVSAKPC
jgi:hypothetical protein